MPLYPNQHINTGDRQLDIQLRKMARSIQTAAHVGGGISRSPQGTVHHQSSRRRAAFPGRRQRGGNRYLYTTISKPGAHYIANVTPGHVNGIIPASIFTDLTVVDGNYVYLTVTTDGKSVTAVTKTAGALPAAPLLPSTSGQAPTTFYIPLALIHDTGGGALVCYRLNSGNILALPKQVMLTAKSGSIAAGSEAFDRWWTWVVKQPA